MENNNKETSFKYTYSAKEQDEIKKIRQKYQMQEEDGMSKLRKLDAKVSQKATVASLIIGIVGTLIMGMGMSLIMTDLSVIMKVSDITGMIIGIVVGVLGLVLLVLAYPVYVMVLKKEQRKAAPEIISLTETLLK